MIAKGTQEYKMAAELAKRIEMNSHCPRTESNFDPLFERFARFVYNLTKIGGFAGEVAKTVDSSLNPHSYTWCRISSKQAWILACAAIENKIEY